MAPPVPPTAAATAIEPPPVATRPDQGARSGSGDNTDEMTFCSSGIEAQLDKKNASTYGQNKSPHTAPRSKLVLVERDAKSAMSSLSKIAGKAKVSNCVQADLVRHAHIYLRVTRHA
jgi:hypothetical protein